MDILTLNLNILFQAILLEKMSRCGVWPETSGIMAHEGFTSVQSIRDIDDESIMDTIGNHHNLVIGQICALKGLARYLNTYIHTETSGQMDEIYKDKITLRYYIITEKTTESTLKCILRYLVSKSVIARNEEMECSQKEYSYKERTAKLLKVIMTKSDTEFLHLAEAFKIARKRVLGQLLTEGELQSTEDRSNFNFSNLKIMFLQSQ